MLMMRKPSQISIGNVGERPGHHHTLHNVGQDARLADDGGMGWIGDVQDDQSRADADVSIVPLQGDGMHRAAYLAHHLDVAHLLLGCRRVYGFAGG